ncbi:hypothetical protein [Pantoea sp. CCBC3-3-1]|uniref:hypothetical protein n=1 Tax=Pantoea sp. CCBC3-3-1 TaxID=2490851 RepID=UPI0011BFB98A|nr:hypothetical protein [Pantoea sp. CCBC3-3-1]
MATDNLQMRFTREMFTPNGLREISSTSDVDAALGNLLLSVFDGLQVSDPRTSAKGFKQFLTRSGRDKLKLGAFDDVETLLQAVRSADGGRRDDQSTSYSNVNRDALPIINLGRFPGFQLHDNSLAVDIYDAGYLANASGEKIALLSLVPVEISYSIMVLSSEKEALSTMIGVISTWLRQFALQGGNNFTAQTQLVGSNLMLQCMFRDAKAVLVNDLTPSLTTDRIFAASIPVTVIAPLYTAWLGTPSTGKIEVYREGVNYSAAAPRVPLTDKQQIFGEVV